MNKRSFFRELLNTNDPKILQRFCKVAMIETCGKGERLITKGEAQGSLYFLVDGILRGFWGSHKGKEATECFISVSYTHLDVYKRQPVDEGR